MLPSGAMLIAFVSLLPAVGAVSLSVHRDLPARYRRDVAGNCAHRLRDLVIGVVDDVARPILVGKGIWMPDYVVLISSIAAMRYSASTDL